MEAKSKKMLHIENQEAQAFAKYDQAYFKWRQAKTKWRQANVKFSKEETIVDQAEAEWDQAQAEYNQKRQQYEEIKNSNHINQIAGNWYKHKQQIIQKALYGDDKEAFHTHMKILAKK